jgi:hypothetical protein
MLIFIIIIIVFLSSSSTTPSIKEAGMDRLAIWGLMCGLVGAGFLANALWIYLTRRKFLASAVAAEGTVVEVRVEGFGGNAMSMPTFEFRTGTGELQRAESLMGSGLQRFRVGQVVAVWYDPSAPQRAEVASFAVLWGLALLRAGFGGLFLLMGIVAVVVSMP